MKHQAVFRVLLVLGILANIGVLGFLATEKPVPFAVEAWEPFKSETGWFSVKYPRDWKASENVFVNEAEARFTTADDVKLIVTAPEKGSPFTDLIKFNPTSSDPPLKVFHEMLIDSLKARYPCFKEAATTPVKVGKLDALSTTFDYKTMDGLKIRTMKGAAVSIWNGESHFALRLCCPADEFEDMLPMFSVFMQSFKCKIIQPGVPGGKIPIPLPF